MEIATRASSGKAYMHSYKFDSKGTTNIKSWKEISHRLLVPEKTILEKFCHILALQQSRMCNQYH